MLPLLGRASFMWIFFVTWTMIQVVFLVDFWNSKDNNCRQYTSNHKDEKIISLLTKELAQLRAFVGRSAKTGSGLSDEVTSIMPLIYIITPTYARPTQKADLVRLSQTLMLVPNIHWIVVEDSNGKTKLVSNLLLQTGLAYTHLHVETPQEYKLKSKNPRWIKPRGVLQRNAGLRWIRGHVSDSSEGVVYFADDDNTYHVQLFEEMRYTQSISTWPVGLSGELFVERPYVKDGKIVGWNSLWNPNRPFPNDMAGFAVNLKLILSNTDVVFNLNNRVGYQESAFITKLININELEPKADNCTKVNSSFVFLLCSNESCLLADMTAEFAEITLSLSGS